jgi:hypothetical protein
MKKIDRAREYGARIGASFFQNFVDNPDYRGRNFTWEWCVKAAGEYAETQTWLGQPDKKTKKSQALDEQCRIAAKAAGSAAAQRKLDEMRAQNNVVLL